MMVVTGPEVCPDHQSTLPTVRRQERSAQRDCHRRLLVSDDRFSRRRRLPRLASPVSTDEVETSHPLLPAILTRPGRRIIPVSAGAALAVDRAAGGADGGAVADAAGEAEHGRLAGAERAALEGGDPAAAGQRGAVGAGDVDPG